MYEWGIDKDSLHEQCSTTTKKQKIIAPTIESAFQ